MGRLNAPPLPSPPVASPCTGVCTLDGDDYCTGCGRTLDEIARWSAMTDTQRGEVRRRVRPG